MEKFKLLCLSLLCIPFTLNAEVASFGNSEVGTISIGGDAELNINFRDNELKEDGSTEDSNEIDQDGRLMLQFFGEKSVANDMYVSFIAEPLFNTTGSVTLDDSYLQFGKKSSWSIRVGRFEAFDMFPKPQDVFVEYTGNTSNLLYQDNTSYSYQISEARGRADEGQIMFTKTFNDLYLEANFLTGERSDLFVNGEYHGVAIDPTKTTDTVIARPIISYQISDVNLAIGAEVNLIPDSVVDDFGRDILERYGYAGKLSWAHGNFTLHTMFAYLDALNEINKTYGVTGAWKDVISLGLIYSMNKYNEPGFREGDINLGTLYASYAFRNVMGIDKFSILLGSYFSDIDRDLSFPVNNADESILQMGGDAGGRIRLYYEF